MSNAPRRKCTITLPNSNNNQGGEVLEIDERDLQVLKEIYYAGQGESPVRDNFEGYFFGSFYQHAQLSDDDDKRVVSLYLYDLLGPEPPSPAIGKLEALQCLTFYNCKFGSLPSEIGNLSNLTELWLRTCRSLQSLPDEIGNLSKLKNLNILNCNSAVFSS